MADHSRVIRISRFVPAPAMRAELLAALHELAIAVRRIEGCFGVQVCDVSEDPTAVIVVSRWSSAEAVARMPVEQVRARVAHLVVGEARTEHLIPL